jgi:hemerythrin-like domain-containing protein
MRIRKALRADQEFTSRFLSVLGKALIVTAESKFGQPGFFILAGRFIHDYMEPAYFKKVEVLLDSLEHYGFPSDQGPVGNMHKEHQKGREISRLLDEAAQHWKEGDQVSRADVIWAGSEYTSLMRRHSGLLNNLIFPLLEQSFSVEEEQGIAARVNLITSSAAAGRDKYVRLVELLEEEVSDWR